jgi:hypothetical protein
MGGREFCVTGAYGSNESFASDRCRRSAAGAGGASDWRKPDLGGV